MQPKPKNLILDLLLAREGEALSARECIAACALFGIRDSTVRVALVRLSAEGLIEASERGSYVLSAAAHELADEVATWRRSEQRVREWQGGYLVVHCGGLRRSNRAALRQRERALRMLGFRELEWGLFLRPDNLGDGVAGVRERLRKLGLQGEASVFAAADFDAERSARIKKLWDGKALNASYRKLTAQLETWMARAETLDTEVAARESFLLGGKAIREIVYDPLLPTPFVDIEARRAFVDAVHRFDALGKAIWRASQGIPLKTETAGQTARKH